MKPLLEMNCQHDDKAKVALDTYLRDQHMAELKGWKPVNGGKGIQRIFEFKNFYHTMSFVNAVAWVANKEAHHPDMEVSYAKCVITYTTHDMDGLGINDMICAAKINALTEIGTFGPVVQNS